MSFRYPFLEPHLTTYHSNIIIRCPIEISNRIQRVHLHLNHSCSSSLSRYCVEFGLKHESGLVQRSNSIGSSITLRFCGHVMYEHDMIRIFAIEIHATYSTVFFGNNVRARMKILVKFASPHTEQPKAVFPCKHIPAILSQLVELPRMTIISLISFNLSERALEFHQLTCNQIQHDWSLPVVGRLREKPWTLCTAQVGKAVS
jgi:hypothetical protein